MLKIFCLFNIIKFSHLHTCTYTAKDIHSGILLGR